MKVTIICPSFYDANNNLFKTDAATLPPLTIYYLAGMVPAHHTVQVIDESVAEIDFDKPTDLVAITSTSVNIRRAYEIAKEFKARDTPVVLGGIHASVKKEEALEYVDAVVIGEAEDSWPQLLIDAENRQLKKVYNAPARDSIENLPLPRFDLIDSDKYVKFPFLKGHIVPIQTARGCPHKCSFCSVTEFWGAKMRYRPIADIVQEVIHSKGDTFFFTDDNFLMHPQRTIELCQELSKLNIKFICQIDSIYSEKRIKVLDALAKAGCFMVYIGLESVDPKRLLSMNKKFNKPEKYNELIAALKKRRISTYASIILGLEGDDLNTVDYTVTFLIKCKVGMAAFFPITPFPGTALFDDLKKKNLLRQDKWWLTLGEPGSENLVDFPANQYTECELSERANRDFYSLSSMIKRLIRIDSNFLLPLMFNIVAKKRLKGSGNLTKL